MKTKKVSASESTAVSSGLSAATDDGRRTTDDGRRTTDDSVKWVLRKEVRPDAEQPRRVFDGEKLAELAESLRVVGQQEACLVEWVPGLTVREPDLVNPTWQAVDGKGAVVSEGTETAVRKFVAEQEQNSNHQQPNSKSDGRGYYKLVNGERRWRAAEVAGVERLLVRVADTSDPKWGERKLAIQMALNQQHENLSALEEGEAYRREIESGRQTAETLWKALGISRATMFSRLALNKLEPVVREAVVEGKISVSVAGAIAMVPGKEKQAELLDRASGGDYDKPMSFREVQEEIEGEFCQPLKGAPFKVEDAELLAPEWRVYAEIPKSNHQPSEKPQGSKGRDKGSDKGAGGAVVVESVTAPIIPASRKAYVAETQEDDGQGHLTTVCHVFEGLSYADHEVTNREKLQGEAGDVHDWEKTDLVSGVDTNYKCKACGTKGVRHGFGWPPATKVKECTRTVTAAELKQRVTLLGPVSKGKAKAFVELVLSGQELKVERMQGGGCGDCPYRSGNMAEYPEAGKRPNVCTRPGCYSAKVKAHWVRAAGAAVAKGETVLDLKEWRKRTGEFVGVEESVWTKNRGSESWKKLCGKHAPGVTLATTEKGLVGMYLKAAAAAAARKNGVELYREQEARAETPEEKAKQKEKEEREKAATQRRQRVVEAALPVLAGKLAKVAEGRAWELLVESRNDRCYGDAATRQKVLLGEKPTCRTRVLAGVFAATSPVGYYQGQWESSVVKLWAGMGVDLVGLEKEAIEKEKKETKDKDKGSDPGDEQDSSPATPANPVASSSPPASKALRRTGGKRGGK